MEQLVRAVCDTKQVRVHVCVWRLAMAVNTCRCLMSLGCRPYEGSVLRQVTPAVRVPRRATRSLEGNGHSACPSCTLAGERRARLVQYKAGT